MGSLTGCEIGAPLASAAYDVTKSRFAWFVAFAIAIVSGNALGFGG
jgi:hypothetical protein